MLSRHLPARRASSLALAVLLSGLPALAGAAEPSLPVPPARSATPIADAARAAAAHHGYGRHDDSNALMWTGFGLVAGGIMAGVGVGLMVMASHSGHRGHGRYPSVTMQRGRMIVQQRVGF